MTTLASLQQVLETLASNRPARTTLGATDEPPTYASVVNARKTTGWDPHDVWLDRIKRPRDARRAN